MESSRIVMQQYSGESSGQVHSRTGSTVQTELTLSDLQSLSAMIEAMEFKLELANKERSELQQEHERGQTIQVDQEHQIAIVNFELARAKIELDQKLMYIKKLESEVDQQSSKLIEIQHEVKKQGLEFEQHEKELAQDLRAKHQELDEKAELVQQLQAKLQVRIQLITN